MSDISRDAFDYAELDPKTRAAVKAHEDRIHALTSQMQANMAALWAEIDDVADLDLSMAKLRAVLDGLDEAGEVGLETDMTKFRAVLDWLAEEVGLGPELTEFRAMLAEEGEQETNGRRDQ